MTLTNQEDPREEEVAEVRVHIHGVYYIFEGGDKSSIDSLITSVDDRMPENFIPHIAANKENYGVVDVTAHAGDNAGYNSASSQNIIDEYLE